MIFKIMKFCQFVFFWTAYILVAYLLFLIVYNIIRAKPYKWPFIICKKLFFYGVERFRRIRFYFKECFVLFKTTLSTWWLNAADFWLQCIFFWRFYSFDYCTDFSNWPKVRQLYVQELQSVLTLMLKKHYAYIRASSIHFVRRPFIYHWSVFRFLKHFIGWSLGIAFYYYCFIWFSYAIYFCFDFLFLFLDITYNQVLKPCFLANKLPRLLFANLYRSSVTYWKFLILVKVFEQVPFTVKTYKDYYISRNFFYNVLVYSLVLFIIRKLLILLAFILRFLLFKGRFQTLHFYARIKSLILFLYYYGFAELGRFKRNFFTIKRNVRRFLRIINWTIFWAMCKYFAKGLSKDLLRWRRWRRLSLRIFLEKKRASYVLFFFYCKLYFLILKYVFIWLYFLVFVFSPFWTFLWVLLLL